VRTQHRGLLIGGVILAVACGGGLYASPYITLYQMYQAVERKDVQEVSNYVDFPALRDSVKTNLKTVVTKETAQSSNPILGLLGSVMGGVVLDPVVDNLVTPSGVAALLEGQQLQLGAKGSKVQFEPGKGSPDVKAEYESFNQFAVSVKPKGEAIEPVTILLSRNGFSWKISGVRLPSSLAFAKEVLPQSQLPQNKMPEMKSIKRSISKFLEGGI
jgi:Protein of unknown function (DUF2939)